MNYQDAKNEVKGMTNEDLATKLKVHEEVLKGATNKAAPGLAEARRLSVQAQEILTAVEDDRIMVHAIIEIQKERK